MEVPPGPIPVAIVLTSFDFGGTERQMTELVRRLDPDRWAVHVACFRRRGPWLPAVEARAASVQAFPIAGFGRVGTFRHGLAFARWCRARRIALVHACDLYANIFALPGAAAARVPVRIGSRRDIDVEPRLARRLLQTGVYRLAHVVVANSDAAARRVAAEGVDPRRIRTIRNGIDLCEFGAATMGPEPWRLITVANLRPEKRLDVLLDALAVLSRHVAPLELTVVGDGPERARLEARARAGGVARLVRFLGARRDVPALLASSGLFVLASRSEASPNAVLEAMACGLPVVATRVGGVPEVVDDGRTGRLVPPDDPGALAEVIADLLARPEWARELGRAARGAVEARFSFDRMVAEFDALYLQQLGFRVARAPQERAHGSRPAEAGHYRSSSVGRTFRSGTTESGIRIPES